MITTETIVTPEQLNKAFENTNFGAASIREVLNNSVLKCASGFETGRAAKIILQELGLTRKNTWALSQKGKLYLWHAYSEGKSY